MNLWYDPIDDDLCSSRGRLVGMPLRDRYEDLELDRLGLVELPSEERHGFVWVVLRPGAPIDVAAHLGAPLVLDGGVVPVGLVGHGFCFCFFGLVGSGGACPGAAGAGGSGFLVSSFISAKVGGCSRLARTAFIPPVRSRCRKNFRPCT